MSETRQARKERLKAILDALNAPGGRVRSDADIAAQFACSERSVHYVRKANPTAEETDRAMKALDSVFPGIYKWHCERLVRKAWMEAQPIRDRMMADGVNSPYFGRMAPGERETGE